MILVLQRGRDNCIAAFFTWIQVLQFWTAPEFGQAYDATVAAHIWGYIIVTWEGTIISTAATMHFPSAIAATNTAGAVNVLGTAAATSATPHAHVRLCSKSCFGLLITQIVQSLRSRHACDFRIEIASRKKPARIASTCGWNRFSVVLWDTSLPIAHTAAMVEVRREFAPMLTWSDVVVIVTAASTADPPLLLCLHQFERQSKIITSPKQFLLLLNKLCLLVWHFNFLPSKLFRRSVYYGAVF